MAKWLLGDAVPALRGRNYKSIDTAGVDVRRFFRRATPKTSAI
jgi:hypothetical protein